MTTDEILAYIGKTPENTNFNILRELLNDMEGGSAHAEQEVIINVNLEANDKNYLTTYTDVNGKIKTIYLKQGLNRFSILKHTVVRIEDKANLGAVMVNEAGMYTDHEQDVYYIYPGLNGNNYEMFIPEDGRVITVFNIQDTVEEIPITVGFESGIQFQISYVDAGEHYEFTLSDPEIATIHDGGITFLKPGAVNITATVTSSMGSFEPESKTITLHVYPPAFSTTPNELYMGYEVPQLSNMDILEQYIELENTSDFVDIVAYDYYAIDDEGSDIEGVQLELTEDLSGVFVRLNGMKSEEKSTKNYNIVLGSMSRTMSEFGVSGVKIIPLTIYNWELSK